MNSIKKGKAGELEFAHVLQEYGYPARRSQQYCGTAESADVKCDDLPIHWEVKRVENLNVHKAMYKLLEEAAPGKWRVIAHRKNRTGWLATLPMEDFMDLIKEWKESR